MVTLDDQKTRAYEVGKATALLHHLCLFKASAWLTEQFFGLDPSTRDQTSADLLRGRTNGNKLCYWSRYFTSGRNAFVQNEYLRAATNFDHCHDLQARFMKYYSRYCAEACLRSKSIEGDNSNDGVLSTIRQEIEHLFFGTQVHDPFIYYIYGCVSNGKRARRALIKSLEMFPLNWDAWMKLARHIQTKEEMNQIEQKLPKHWVTPFFEISIYTKLREFDKSKKLLENMEELFPCGRFFYAELAKIKFFEHEYEHSLTLFETLLTLDPHRVEDVDIYAALLYVLGKKVELSALARRFLEQNKFTPQACCIVGHHYSLQQQPAKAITYFERAFRLDKDFLVAKLYMAQEHMELRNHTAALETAQYVVDRDPRNAHAWHTLGQAYELGEAITLAEQAYTEACCLDSHVGAMWLSRGVCKHKLWKLEDAEHCLQRALKEGCKDVTAKYELDAVRKKLYPDQWPIFDDDEEMEQDEDEGERSG